MTNPPCTSWRAALLIAAASLAPAASVAQESQAPGVLSAFFGLDNALPPLANALCPGASGKDGMPLVLSHTIDPETLRPEHFRVFTRSGAEHTPLCVTLRPADDAGELRTVLMIGELGNANDDPPVRAVVVGDAISDGSAGTPVSFRGAEVQVTPLEDGPSLILAQVVPEIERPDTDRGSPCPEDTRQAVRATWAGGVRRPDRQEAGDSERALYRITVERSDGSRAEIEPAALADLGDNDNNHLLCLDTDDTPVSVAFPAGHLVDPNQDLNPETQVAVTG